MIDFQSLINQTVEVLRADEAVRLAAETAQQEAEKNALVERMVEVFKSEFGKPDEDSMNKADEAFFILMSAGRHCAIAKRIKKDPGAFNRPNRIRAFISGYSEEVVLDETGQPIFENGKKKMVPREYPPAPKKEAEELMKVVLSALMARFNELAPKYQYVNRTFWYKEGKEGFNPETAPVATELNRLMNSVLNIVEPLGSPEDFKKFAGLFHKIFGQLPPSDFYRVRDVLGLNKPADNGHRASGQVVNGSGEARPRQERRNGKRPVLRVEETPGEVRPDMAEQFRRIGLRTPEDHETAQVEEGRRMAEAEEATTIN